MNTNVIVIACAIFVGLCCWYRSRRQRKSVGVFHPSDRNIHLALDLVVFSAKPVWDSAGGVLRLNGSIFCYKSIPQKPASHFELERTDSFCEVIEPSRQWKCDQTFSLIRSGKKRFRYLVALKYSEIYQSLDVEIRRLNRC